MSTITSNLLSKIILSLAFFISLFSFAQAPEITVLGANISIISGSTTTTSTNNTDFGVYDVNSGVKSKTFTIRNDGNSNLILSSTPVILLPGSSPTFTISNQPPSNSIIAPGASRTFTIAFNPTALITTNATVSIGNNDANENPFRFLIEGEGVKMYSDTDGDGLSNNLDTDDDNDGIPDATEQLNCLASSGSTVVETVFLNENFGAGINRVRINGTTPGVTTNYCFEDGTTAQASDECNTNINLGDGKYTVHYSITDADGINNEISNTGPDLAIWADYAWTSNLDHTPSDTNGRMAIFNASMTPGIFYETTVVGILPGIPVNYSFWVMNIDNQDSRFSAGELPRVLPNITVNFFATDNTTLLGTFNTGNISRCASGNSCVQSLWKQFSTNISLSQSEFIIKFVNNAPGGFGNDLAIDDIKITQTLCDLDADGVADVLDLDNDNDGIPNIMEARMIANPDPDFDATTLGSGWSDSNNNGLRDNFENLVPVNTDGDSVPDYMDLDSDNDAVFDAYEYDNFGDIDINGDGAGDGNDIITATSGDGFDGDGILGIMDTKDNENNNSNNAYNHGNSGYPLPLDSDSDGIPNYMDIYNNTTSRFDILNTLYANFDANNNGIIDGTIDADKDGILNPFDTNDASFGSPRDLNNKYSLIFDGRNDYIEESQNIVLGLSQATIMSWIKLDTNFSNEGVIVGQDKFHIKINNSKRAAVEVNGVTLALNGSVNTLPVNKWIHIAAVFDGPNNSQTVRLYVNGELKDAKSESSSIQSSANTLFRIGRNPSANATDYFKGEIDEVRVFNAALTDDQIQKIVYQELKDSNFSMGDIIPLNIPSLISNSLIRYFKMDSFKHDIVDNKVTPAVDLLTGAKLFNIKEICIQTAPMPFLSIADGAWTSESTWKYGSVWDISNVTTNKPWSIVHIKHNVTTTAHNENLGLIIDSGKELTLNNDVLFKNSWYIKLNGKLDLQGRSQLIQTVTSQLDPTSSGFLERDQQGAKNLFNFNYWSSPVSIINNTVNNNGYTVSSIFKDGTLPANVQNINWITGYNGAATSPRSVASYWIFKFQNITNLYSNWTQIGSAGTLLSGQGFTMKGVGTSTTAEVQNYTFVGKPNNGTIINAIAAGNINLSGNPYPSALDSQEFIKDNIGGFSANSGTSNAINGTLYFWQHANENNSHQLANYVGGYATLNLIGGVPPMSVSVGTAGIGSAARTPNRYIPVGQGFFVSGSAVGGNITFKNTQRAFKLETDTTPSNGSNIIFRQTAALPAVALDTIKKIRLDFTTVDGFKRELLLGFMETNATDNIDDGYDAKAIDSNCPSDVYFTVGSEKLIIQGVGDFINTSSYALGLKTNLSGNIQFKINTTNNFEASQTFFIFDSQTNIYHEITNQAVDINLPVGTYENRFSLRFTTGLLNTATVAMDNEFSVFFNTNEKVLNIKNTKQEATVKRVLLYNVLGQETAVWDTKNLNQNLIQLPITNAALGTYIVKMETSNGDLSKKIMIN